MKIQFAIKSMDGISGGAERVLACIASGLVARGHDVSILSFDRAGGKSFYPLNPKIRRICLESGDGASRTTLAEMLDRLPKLRRAVLAERPDIVIGFMHSMFVPLALALTGTHIPVIASEHIVPRHYRDHKLEFLLLLVSAALVRQMTVTSPAVHALYPEILQHKIVPVPNPVSLLPVSADVDGADLPVRTILNVGRLDPQKNQQALIEAFARLAPRHTGWQLRIVGEGPLRKVLERRIGALGLEDRVALPGAVTDIAAEYGRAQIFALPSHYESFGLVTAEAMASGLPVIGFADCPGTNELIRNGENGVLIPAADRVSGMVNALKQLMDDPALRARFGQRGLQMVQAYKPEGIIKAWEDLIGRIVQQSRS
jgi:glycosyltransferase involved in cell wall biosynthesis